MEDVTLDLMRQYNKEALRVDSIGKRRAMLQHVQDDAVCNERPLAEEEA